MNFHYELWGKLNLDFRCVGFTKTTKEKITTRIGRSIELKMKFIIYEQKVMLLQQWSIT